MALSCLFKKFTKRPKSLRAESPPPPPPGLNRGKLNVGCGCNFSKAVKIVKLNLPSTLTVIYINGDVVKLSVFSFTNLVECYRNEIS